MRSVEKYLETRFASLEANEFWPISGSRCCMVSGLIRAYRALSKEDQARYRKIIARRGATFWAGSESKIDRDEEAWATNFLISCFPPEYPDGTRELAKAKELRKMAKLCFEQFLGAKPAKSLNPGDWLYEGRLDEVPVSVELRYACTMTQIEYGVHLQGMEQYTRISAEALYGLGIGRWNRVYLAEIDQAFALLRDLISMVVADHVTIVRLMKEHSS